MNKMDDLLEWAFANKGEIANMNIGLVCEKIGSYLNLTPEVIEANVISKYNQMKTWIKFRYSEITIDDLVDALSYDLSKLTGIWRTKKEVKFDAVEFEKKRMEANKNRWVMYNGKRYDSVEKPWVLEAIAREGK